MAKPMESDELYDYLKDTILHDMKNIDKNGNKLDIEDMIDVLMSDDKIITAWNNSLTVDDSKFDKAIDKLSRAIEISCKENFDVTINVF